MAVEYQVKYTPGFDPTIVNVSQNDVGRQFDLKIIDETGAAQQIPSGSTVKFVGMKPSGLGFTVNCTFTNSVVHVTTTDIMTDEHGLIPAEVQITNGNTVIGTANVNLRVEKNPHPEGTIDDNIIRVIPTFNAIFQRLNTLESSMSTAQNNISNLQTRMTTAEGTLSNVAGEVEQQSGAITNIGTELGGIRTGYDGTVYLSAGDAVRAQAFRGTDTTLTVSGMAADAMATGDSLTELKEDLSDLNDDLGAYSFGELFSELELSEAQNLYNKDTAEDGYIAANGNTSPSTTYCHSAKIPVEVGKFYSFWALYNGNIVSANARFLCAYDSNGIAVSSAGSNSAVASYTVPTTIDSIVVSFEQNRKHLFMVVEGSETPSGLLPYNLEHYIANPSFISSAVGDILRTNEQLKISVTSATANTEYELVEHLDNKKNCAYSFFGKFSSFTSVEIGHGKTETGANYLVIDGTNITSYRPNGTEYAHYAHNLTIADFISVSIKIADTASQRATVTIITNGGSATVGNVIFFGCNGAIYFICGQETTEVDFAYSIMDLRKDIYVFGDSYISLSDDKRWPNYAITNKDNNMLLSGFPGADASEEYPSFEKILSMGIPKYLCWFLGMNNKETSAPNPNWIVVTSQVIAACKAKGIIPILATIPNTPTQNNTYKNSWVKASGERYVDFARAVGAEELGSSWYEGMLSGDNVHPTAEGAKALWLQLRLDVPEIMQSITT